MALLLSDPFWIQLVSDPCTGQLYSLYCLASNSFIISIVLNNGRNNSNNSINIIHISIVLYQLGTASCGSFVGVGGGVVGIPATLAVPGQ